MKHITIFLLVIITLKGYSQITTNGIVNGMPNTDSVRIVLTQSTDTTFSISNVNNKGLLIRQNNSPTLQIKPNGDVKCYNDFTYDFPHGLMAKDSTPITFGNVARYVWTKLSVGATVVEADDIGMYADSVKILKAGSYRVFMAACVRGGLDYEFKIQAFKNNVATSQGGRFSGEGTSNYVLFSWFWYLDNLNVNDYISFKYQNQSSGNAPLTVLEYKLLIEKITED